jgi:hypothetical protein
MRFLATKICSPAAPPISLGLLVIAFLFLPFEAFGQTQSELPEGCVRWKEYTKTVFVTQPVTEKRTVNETSYETQEVEKYRNVWKTQELVRTVTEEKPITRTSERVSRKVVTKPVTTTKYRTRTRVEESYEDVTEMREETYTVRKPIVETSIEEREIRTRRPVIRTRIEEEQVTAYVPRETTQTVLAPATVAVPGTAVRPRPRWLSPGYYTDPVTGQSVYRRRGFHWVDEPAYRPATVVVPQTSSAVTLVPETFTREKPVQETTYVDEYETRRVPVERRRIVEEVRTRKVPVTTRVPKREIIEEEIPYTETTYVDEVIEQTVPVTETVMERVTKKVPYTRMEAEWVPYVEKVRVPKTVAKQVRSVSTYRVPYLVRMRVAVDAFGRTVGPAVQVQGSHKLHPNWRSMMTEVADADQRLVRENGVSTTARKPMIDTDVESARSILERGPASFDVSAADSENASARNSQDYGTVNVETAPVGPGSPPDSIEFPQSNSKSLRETSGKLVPIRRDGDAEVEDEEPESELARQMRQEVDDRLRRAGLKVDGGSSRPRSGNSATPATRTLRETNTPSEGGGSFEPDPLSIDVNSIDVDSIAAPLPPDAASDSDDVDDTIERDVKVSRPSRSE